MSSEIIIHAIDAALPFAMAHPVAATVIVVSTVVVAGVVYLGKEYLDSKKSDEDRGLNTSNNVGKIRQN